MKFLAATALLVTILMVSAPAYAMLPNAISVAPQTHWEILYPSSHFDLTASPDQSSGSYIPTEGATWSHTALNVFFYPNSTAPSEYNADIPTVAHQALLDWQQSIDAFATDNPQYSYLRAITFDYFVVGINDTQAPAGRDDINVKYSATVCPKSLACTVFLISNNQFTSPVTIDILRPLVDPTNAYSANAPQLAAITHEFGHSLGLGHASISGDLMFYALDNEQPILYPSTLDLYALSSIYAWVPYLGVCTSSFCPTIKVQNVTLPATISYQEQIPYSVLYQDTETQIAATATITASIISNLETEVNALQSQAVQYQRQITSLNTNITALKVNVASLNLNITQLQSAVKSLNGQVASLNNQIASLKSQNSALQSQVASLTVQTDNLNSKIVTLQNIVASLNTKISDLDAQIAQYRTALFITIPGMVALFIILVALRLRIKQGSN